MRGHLEDCSVHNGGVCKSRNENESRSSSNNRLSSQAKTRQEPVTDRNHNFTTMRPNDISVLYTPQNNARTLADVVCQPDAKTEPGTTLTSSNVMSSLSERQSSELQSPDILRGISTCEHMSRGCAPENKKKSPETRHQRTGSNSERLHGRSLPPQNLTGGQPGTNASNRGTQTADDNRYIVTSFRGSDSAHASTNTARETPRRHKRSSTSSSQGDSGVFPYEVNRNSADCKPEMCKGVWNEQRRVEENVVSGFEPDITNRSTVERNNNASSSDRTDSKAKFTPHSLDSPTRLSNDSPSYTNYTEHYKNISDDWRVSSEAGDGASKNFQFGRECVCSDSDAAIAALDNVLAEQGDLSLMDNLCPEEANDSLPRKTEDYDGYGDDSAHISRSAVYHASNVDGSMSEAPHEQTVKDTDSGSDYQPSETSSSSSADEPSRKDSLPAVVDPDSVIAKRLSADHVKLLERALASARDRQSVVTSHENVTGRLHRFKPEAELKPEPEPPTSRFAANMDTAVRSVQLRMQDELKSKLGNRLSRFGEEDTAYEMREEVTSTLKYVAEDDLSASQTSETRLSAETSLPQQQTIVSAEKRLLSSSHFRLQSAISPGGNGRSSADSDSTNDDVTERVNDVSQFLTGTRDSSEGERTVCSINVQRISPPLSNKHLYLD